MRHQLSLVLVAIPLALGCGGDRANAFPPSQVAPEGFEPCPAAPTAPAQAVAPTDPIGDPDWVADARDVNTIAGAEPEPAYEIELGQPELMVPGWQSWTTVTERRLFSDSHSSMWVEIYVPNEYVEAYVHRDLPIPSGMRIVKAQYDGVDTSAPINITAMIRQEHAESGWYWGIYAPDGTTAQLAGRLESCIACHAHAGDDYLFRRIE